MSIHFEVVAVEGTEVIDKWAAKRMRLPLSYGWDHWALRDEDGRLHGYFENYLGAVFRLTPLITSQNSAHHLPA